MAELQAHGGDCSDPGVSGRQAGGKWVSPAFGTGEVMVAASQ